MEAFFALFGCSALALTAVGGVLGLIAYSRARSLEARLASLERRLAEQARKPDTTEPARPPPVPAAASAPMPAPAPIPAATVDTTRATPTVPAVEPRQPVEPARQAAGPWSSDAPRASDPPASDRPPTSIPAAPAPRPAAEKPNWERWLGVRGAAVVGGIFLALAGILFFQYSIEHGWITPTFRVAIGTALGIGCIVASEPLRRRGYSIVANAVTGAGAVILYAAFWAAHALFDLWPFALAFGVMALVTVACCLLALRHSSQLIAGLGLIGGFATPILLATGQDRPIGLFGYVLLLDIGFLFAARKKRWPAIGLVGLLGTCAIEGLWIFDRMSAQTLGIGLVVLGMFALLFVVSSAGLAREERERWALPQVGAVLLPFAFALHFAQHEQLGARLWQLALLAALLAAAAGWIARTQRVQGASLGAAAAVASVVWLAVTSLAGPPPGAFEIVGCCVGLALVFHLFCELPLRGDPTRADDAVRGHALSAASVAVLLFGALMYASARARDGSSWIWFGGELALTLLLYRQAALVSRDAAWGNRWGWLQVAASVLLGIGIAWWGQAHRAVATPSASAFLALLLALSLLLQQLVRMRRNPEGQKLAGWAACAYHVPALLAIEFANIVARGEILLVLGGWFALALAGASSASLARAGAWFAAILAFACGPWGAPWRYVQNADRDRMAGLLAILAASAVAFSLWPWLFRARWSRGAWAYRGGALTGILLLAAFEEVIETAWGRSAIALLPLALAALAGTVARDLGRAETREPDVARRRPLWIGSIWYAAAAMYLVCLALPLQLDRGIWLVTTALFAAGLVLLWRRRDHPPLKYIALALIAGASYGRLQVRAGERFPVYEHLVANWLAYDLLVPAAAALAVAIALAPLEIARLRAAERGLYAGGFAAGSAIASVCAIVLVFAWINLSVLNAFGEEPRLRIDFPREPARDMTISIAWAVYALLLLGLGVSRRIGFLRWTSLILLIATIGKVFLLDLGNLEGLYRIASLFGLALSLLFVSLVYQRFVFRPARTAVT